MENGASGLRGYVIDAPIFGTLRSERDGAVIIENGRILARGNFGELRNAFASGVQWGDYGSVAIFPGLIDCHTHLPQYSAVARGESQLLPWLRDIIFPIEREFTGERAREGAALFFRELAHNGTSTAAIFTAIYEDSCDRAFEAAQASGLRATSGK